MYILSAVELWGSAGADAVCAEGLDGFFFDLVVAYEVVKVVGREIGDGPAVGEFYFGSCWSAPISSCSPIDRSAKRTLRLSAVSRYQLPRMMFGVRQEAQESIRQQGHRSPILKCQRISLRNVGINPPLQSASQNYHCGSSMKVREGIE